MDGYGFFKIYTPLKLHFTQESYDGFKYNWKTKSISNGSFALRKDRFLFEKWGRQFKDPVAAGHLVISNFIYNSDAWVYEDPQDARDVYDKWKMVRESITKTFEDDLYELTKHNLKSWDVCISKTPKGNLPPLLQLYLAQRVHPESVVIANNISPFIDKWENTYSTDPLIKDKLVKLKKYVPFVKYNRDRVKEKFEGLIENNHAETI